MRFGLLVSVGGVAAQLLFHLHHSNCCFHFCCVHFWPVDLLVWSAWPKVCVVSCF